jgi:hypothetical protein
LSDLNIHVPILGRINSARYEDDHQLDIRIDRKWEFNSWKLQAYLDITNVYAHAKTIGLAYNFDYTESETITEVPIFPAFGIRGKF